jgi:hypothetical protein
VLPSQLEHADPDAMGDAPLEAVLSATQAAQAPAEDEVLAAVTAVSQERAHSPELEEAAAGAYARVLLARDTLHVSSASPPARPPALPPVQLSAPHAVSRSGRKCVRPLTFAQEFDTAAAEAPPPLEDLELARKPASKRQTVILPALQDALQYQGPSGIILLVVLTIDSKGRSRPVLALPAQRDPRLARSDNGDILFTLQEGERLTLPCSNYPKVTAAGVTVRMSKVGFPVVGGEGDSPGTEFHVITAPCDDSGLIQIARDLWDEVSN